MLFDIVTHPLSQSQSLSQCNLQHKFFYALNQSLYFDAHFLAAFDGSLYNFNQALIVAFTEKYFVYGELLNKRGSLVVYVGAEIELLLPHSISGMGSPKVLSQLRNGNIQVYIGIFVELSSDHMNKQDISRVLVRCELYFHGSKFNPPSYLIICWYFEPH